ncbi:GntR family transcriptional regulator, partial [uncultured Agrococcus sp.]|uniref:GntR family transcriptional regulator n=1 Tax=uncultured Agrococcus sp. TaxID=382258 RepID=UPI0025FB60FC
LRTLAAEGLVTLVANAGAWVSKLSAAEVTELYEIRERIDPLLLRYNIPHLSDETVDELERLADEMEAAPDAATFIEFDRRFHLLSYSAADTLTLQQTATNLWNRTQHYRREFVTSARIQDDHRADMDHRLMIAAIRNRDADEASRVLAMHIRRTKRELERMPEIFE